jgi:hypothetical protein
MDLCYNSNIHTHLCKPTYLAYLYEPLLQTWKPPIVLRDKLIILQGEEKLHRRFYPLASYIAKKEAT